MKGVAVLEEKPAVRAAEATAEMVGVMRQMRAAAVVWNKELLNWNILVMELVN
jgi:hypothetical protein